ncbi:AI-2E family transporter [Microcoleus sp. Pol17_C1]|uniref:AI-2E family transporter n=1 Tax=unclassified Microcoleus TaxID=2642155 RepID=UPI002FCE70B7
MTRLFVNGIVAFIFAFIPYIGEFLSVISARLLLLDSPWKAGEVLLLYFLIKQFAAGNFVSPILIKKQVSWLPNYP